jgi:outer membrane protein assembly factor BamB
MSEFGGNTPNWGYAESVLIVDDKAIVTPGGKNCMVALDTQTGRTIWTSRGNGAKAHYCSAIAVPYRGRTMLVNGNRGGIFGVDASDGKVRWSNDFCSGNTANCPTPAYSKKRVFWANGYGKGGICLKLDDSGKGVKTEESWRTRKMVCHHGGYIIHEGYIYGNHNGGWSCLDLTTGEQRWFDRGVGKGSLCYADGMLYLFSERGGKAALVEATPEGFRMSGSFSVSGKGPSWAHPVVTGGRLYLRYGSNLYCYNVRR